MRATKQFNNVDTQSKITINTDELQAMLSCGRYSAIQIGEAAEARIQIGKRIFWNVEKNQKLHQLYFCIGDCRMNTYLTIMVTILVLTQIVRIIQNTIQLRRQYKLFQAQLGQLDDITQEDLDMQRRAYRLIVDHFEHKRSEA